MVIQGWSLDLGSSQGGSGLKDLSMKSNSLKNQVVWTNQYRIVGEKRIDGLKSARYFYDATEECLR